MNIKTYNKLLEIMEMETPFLTTTYDDGSGLHHVRVMEDHLELWGSSLRVRNKIVIAGRSFCDSFQWTERNRLFPVDNKAKALLLTLKKMEKFYVNNILPKTPNVVVSTLIGKKYVHSANGDISVCKMGPGDIVDIEQTSQFGWNSRETEKFEVSGKILYIDFIRWGDLHSLSEFNFYWTP